MLAKNIQRFRLITFDITDTLIKFRKNPGVQYMETAASMGVNGINQKDLANSFQHEFKALSKIHPNFGANSKNYTWEDWWTQLVGNIFRSVKPNIDPHKLKELTETLIHIYRSGECYAHIDGGKELVKRLRNTRKLGVISNFDQSLDTLLTGMDLCKYFDFILTSYEAGHMKPHPSIYQIALDKCGQGVVKPHQALHIGNQYELDYMGARNAGWSSILITKNSTELNKVQNPTQGYENMKDFIKALDTMEIKW